MPVYIVVSHVIIVIISIILFFIWIRALLAEILPGRKGMEYLATWMFAFSAPLVFHSHMQIMFVDYMPFLVLALIGVDRLIKKGKADLLGICIALIFLVSFFFAIPALICISQ